MLFFYIYVLGVYSMRCESVEVPVWWFGPFFSGGGYCSEATTTILALKASHEIQDKLIWITHHGDAVNTDYLQSMRREDLILLSRMQKYDMINRTWPISTSQKLIVVCNSVPAEWSLPEPIYPTTRCPPLNISEPNSLFVIGRTTFETDRVHEDYVRRMNMMNQIWVPTKFNFDVFKKFGVQEEKLRVIPQPVDTDFFDPGKYKPIALPIGEQVFGIQQQNAQRKNVTVFISIFKWELRKGWDVLLQAYLTEFSSEDNVELYLLTKPFYSSTDFKLQLWRWVQTSLNIKQEDFERLPAVFVYHKSIPQYKVPRFYASADAFVLASRGEGWGRPYVEAMSMGVPIIATNWSAMPTYLNDSVGYPVNIMQHLVKVPAGSSWDFNGHKWANPSVKHLQKQMREVRQNPDEAKRRGRNARQLMMENFSLSKIAHQMVLEFTIITEQIKMDKKEEL